jgi:hypothetical protein
MSKGYYDTVCIDSEDKVPAGYIPLTDFDSQSAAHKRLSDAHREGQIRAVKLVRTMRDFRNGRVWVHEGDARELLNGGSPKPPSKERIKPAGGSATQFEAAVIALCEINNGITLIHATLERLATAVESIATQPRKDEFAEFTNN